MTAETSSARKGNTRRFFGYLKDFKLPFVIAVLGMVGYSGVDTFMFYHMQPIIDESLGAQNYEYLKLAAYFVVPVFIVRGLFNFMGSYTLAWIGSKCSCTSSRRSAAWRLRSGSSTQSVSRWPCCSSHCTSRKMRRWLALPGPKSSSTQCSSRELKSPGGEALNQVNLGLK